MNTPYILHIETTTPVCSVALSTGGQLVALRELDEANIHASRLTLLIQEVLQEGQITFADLAAVCVSKGPGSYTGLRIGVSTAKGLCYALDIPLVAVHTLDAMADAFAKGYADWCNEDNVLVPMIDARRMEVYSATYNHKLERVVEVAAKIIDQESFSREGVNGKAILFGSGANKFAGLFAEREDVVVVPGFRNSAAYLVALGYDAYRCGRVEDVAYFEPFYLKEFVATTPKAKG